MAEAETQLGVSFKKWLSIFFAVLGVVQLGLALWLMSLGAEPSKYIMQLFLGPLILFIGLRSWGFKVLRIGPEGLEGYNLLGMRLLVRPWSELSVETEPSGRKKVMQTRKNGRKRLVISSTAFVYTTDELRAVIERIEARPAAS